MPKDKAGYCYIFEYSNGTLKAGRTGDLKERMSSHYRKGRKFGLDIKRVAFTESVEDCHDLEDRMLKILSDRMESLSREYFTGLSILDAIDLINSNSTIYNEVVLFGDYSEYRCKPELMKPSEQCKALGLSGLKELSESSGVSEQTLINWSSNPNKSKLFSALLVGCACLKAGYEIKSGSLYKKVEIPEDEQALEHMPDKNKIKEGEE